MSQFMEADELEAVLGIVASFNNFSTSTVCLGTTEVFDVNGETLGWIGMTPNGSWGFFATNPDA